MCFFRNLSLFNVFEHAEKFANLNFESFLDFIGYAYCIGACGLAPVLTVNGNVYGRLTTADIEGIIAEYR